MFLILLWNIYSFYLSFLILPQLSSVSCASPFPTPAPLSYCSRNRSSKVYTVNCLHSFLFIRTCYFFWGSWFLILFLKRCKAQIVLRMFLFFQSPIYTGMFFLSGYLTLIVNWMDIRSKTLIINLSNFNIRVIKVNCYILIV